MPKKEISSDVRFGSTFLDVKYADKAADGEVLSDKQDASLYLKRPSDGRVVSFDEKVASIYQIISEFNIEYQNTDGYEYPTSADAMFTVSNFKTNAFNENPARDIDILKSNLYFGLNDGVPFGGKMSKDTNGFFAKVNARHVDRNLIGTLTSVFAGYEENNKYVAGSKRSFSQWLAESKLYGNDNYVELRNLNNWAGSNAVLYYRITTSGKDSSGNTAVVNSSYRSCIRINEQSFCAFPTGYAAGIKTIESINVTLVRIEFQKLQYAAYLLNIDENTAETTFKGFIENDGKLIIRDTALYYFIDNYTDRVPETDNTLTHYCVDWKYLKESLAKSVSTSSGSVYVKSFKPDDGSWRENTMWVEKIREVLSNNRSVTLESDNAYEDIENLVYLDTNIDCHFSLSKADKEAVFVQKI